jgi:membrane protease YdiL (CAAX protease family)
VKHTALWLGGVAVAMLAWLAASELHWPARLFLAILLGPAPVLFFLQSHAAASLQSPLPRVPVYVGSIVGLWLLAILTIVATSMAGFTGRVMGFNALRPEVAVLWIVFALLACAAVVVAFKAFGFVDAQLMREIVPVTRREKLVFIGLAVSAGICEELTFRSFMVPALLVATGSLVGAVVLSSTVFGLLHAHQRAGGVARAAVLGLVLCVPFVLTGSILPSMIAHAAVDLIGGIWLSRWLLT